MATERELKFSTADDHVPSTLELEFALRGSGLSLAPGRVTRHVDVYYDVDGRLEASGAALRRRHSQGAVRVALKSDDRVTSGPASGVAGDTAGGLAGALAGAWHERTELEVAVAAQAGVTGEGSTGAAMSWPDAVVAALPSKVSVDQLAPVAELRVRRVAYLVTSEQGISGTVAPVAELAFDEVVCVAPASAAGPGAVALFHEVEIESLFDDEATDPEATLDSLQVVAQAVASVVSLTPSSVSKLTRARALLAALGGG